MFLKLILSEWTKRRQSASRCFSSSSWISSRSDHFVPPQGATLWRGLSTLFVWSAFFSGLIAAAQAQRPPLWLKPMKQDEVWQPWRTRKTAVSSGRRESGADEAEVRGARAGRSTPAPRIKRKLKRVFKKSGEKCSFFLSPSPTLGM